MKIEGDKSQLMKWISSIKEYIDAVRRFGGGGW